MARNAPVYSVPQFIYIIFNSMETPKGTSNPFGNNIYFILQWEINLGAVIQSKAQRLWSVTGSPGFSQAWVWTRAAWFNLISDKKQQAFGTPLQPTSTPHNIISSSTQGVRSTVAVRGEICFHFTTSVAEKTIQMLLHFPHYCSLVWISLLSLLLSVFPQYTHSRGSLVTASHYYPETAAPPVSPVIPLRFPHCQVKQCARQTGFGSQHSFNSTSSLLSFKTSRCKRLTTGRFGSVFPGNKTPSQLWLTNNFHFSSNSTMFSCYVLYSPISNKILYKNFKYMFEVIQKQSPNYCT